MRTLYQRIYDRVMEGDLKDSIAERIVDSLDVDEIAMQVSERLSGSWTDEIVEKLVEGIEERIIEDIVDSIGEELSSDLVEELDVTDLLHSSR
jgi:hypothetical protein